MTQQHPITPPPELVEKIALEALSKIPDTERIDAVEVGQARDRYIANFFANWGADQELEACCSLLELSDDNAREFLQSARRLKSEKQQALEDLDRLIALIPMEGAIAMAEPIRRALERLDA